MLSKFEKYHHLCINIFHLTHSLKKFKPQSLDLIKVSCICFPGICMLLIFSSMLDFAFLLYTLSPISLYTSIAPLLVPVLILKFIYSSRPLLSKPQILLEHLKLNVAITAQIIFYP